MKILDIKREIEGTPFQFETFHDFRGYSDRYKENHNVVTNGHYRIISRTANREKWQVTCFNQEGQLVVMSDVMPLKDCLKFCNIK